MQADDAGFSVRISPKHGQGLDSVWLANWLKEHTQWLKNVFFKYGAVIFRGFSIPDALAFEQVGKVRVSHFMLSGHSSKEA